MKQRQTIDNDLRVNGSLSIIDTLTPEEIMIMDFNPMANKSDTIGYSFGVKNELSGSLNKHSVWKNHLGSLLMSLNNYGSLAINSAEGEGTALAIKATSNDIAVNIEASDMTGIKLYNSGTFGECILLHSSAGNFIRCLNKLGNLKFIVDKDGNVNISGAYKVNGVAIATLLKATATLTAAEAFTGIIKEVIVPPGVGKYINIVTANLIYKFGTVAFNGTNSIVLDYDLSLQAFRLFADKYDTFAPISYQFSLYDWAAGSFASPAGTVKENKGLYFGLDGTPTEGDGTFRVDVIYTIEDY